jgi:glucose/arabinose dehydrogenase
MTFVTSDIYPNWKGHLLVGSLKFQYLELVKLDGAKVIGRQKIDIGRCVMWRKGRTVSFIWGEEREF